MIDLHAHILPGLDDGPPDLAGAVAILQAMAAEGVNTVVASPHADKRYPTTRQQVEEGVATVTAAARAAGLSLRILPGMELSLTPDLVHKLCRGEAIGIAGTRYVCMELPHTQYPHYAERGMYDLLLAGYRPVLNHPERNLGLREQPGQADRLLRMGVRFMITAGSLLGRFGPAAERLARRWVAADPDIIVASDAHDLVRRAPGIRRAVDLARTLGKQHQRAEQEILDAIEDSQEAHP